MTGERLSRVVESLLDGAEEAVVERRWADAADLAQDALAIDANSAEARSLLELSLRHVDRANHQAGRRQVTVLFADMIGSTSLSDSADPEEYTHVVRRYQRACRRAVERYGGRVHDEQGDGMLAVFGHPVASGDDAKKAVVAAMQIVDEIRALNQAAEPALDLGVRLGLDTGLIVADEDGHLYGRTINAAARIQAAARPNTVVVSAATAALAGDAFTMLPLGLYDLKGLTEPQQLFEVGAADRGAELLAAHRIVPLVGRTVELATLRAAWDAAQEGTEGAIALIVGEAGIGKSRLAEEMRGEISAAGHPTVVMQASSLETPAALHPVVRGIADNLELAEFESADERLGALRQLLVDAQLLTDENLSILASLFDTTTDEVPPPTLEPMQLREARLTLLVDVLRNRGAAEPHLLVLEDLHWADATTLELLSRIIDAGLPQGVTLVVTTRPNVEPLRLPGGVRVELQSLSTEESRQLASTLAPVTADEDDIALLAERGDGVPLFIEQLIAGSEDGAPIPPSLAELLQSRLDATGASKPVAQLAATFGRDFDRESLDGAIEQLAELAPDDLAVVAPDSIDAHLSSLVDARLMESISPTEMRFRHALLRDAAYDSQLRAERPARHEAIALALTTRSPHAIDPSLTERIASHFEEAGRSTEAVDSWLRAAHRSSRSGHGDEALVLLDRAERLLENLADADRPSRQLQILITRAGLLMGSQGFAAAGVVESYQRALDICDDLGSNTETAHDKVRALLGVWTYHFNSGNLDESAEVLVRLEEMVEVSAFSGLRGAIDSCRGVEYVYRGRLAEAKALLDVAEARFDHEDIDWATWPLPNDCLAAALANRALAEALMGDTAGSEATVETAIARCDSLAYPFGPYSFAFVRGYEAWALQLVGQPDRSAVASGEAIARAQRHGFTEWIVVGTIHQSVGALLAGDAQAVLDNAGPVIELYRLSGARLGLPSFDGVLATAHLMLGDVATATTLLEGAIEMANETGQAMLLPDLFRLAGLIAATIGDAPTARQHFSAAAAHASEHGNMAALVGVQEVAAQAGFDVGAMTS